MLKTIDKDGRYSPQSRSVNYTMSSMLIQLAPSESVFQRRIFDAKKLDDSISLPAANWAQRLMFDLGCHS